MYLEPNRPGLDLQGFLTPHTLWIRSPCGSSAQGSPWGLPGAWTGPCGTEGGQCVSPGQGAQGNVLLLFLPNVVDPIVIELERPLSCDYLSGTDPQCLSNPWREVAWFLPCVPNLCECCWQRTPSDRGTPLVTTLGDGSQGRFGARGLRWSLKGRGEQSGLLGAWSSSPLLSLSFFLFFFYVCVFSLCQNVRWMWCLWELFLSLFPPRYLYLLTHRGEFHHWLLGSPGWVNTVTSCPSHGTCPPISYVADPGSCSADWGGVRLGALVLAHTFAPTRGTYRTEGKSYWEREVTK